MASKRLEKIKKARSLNDVLDVIKDIAFEFKNSQAVVGRLISSLSAEISFDARGTRPRAKVVDTKFVAPKAAELQKHTAVIDKLYANVLELDAAEAMVKQAFAGHKKQKAALAAIADLKADVDASINDAFDALQEIANKHLPASMTKFVDGVTEYLLDVVDSKTFKDIFRQTYVTFDQEDKAALHFSEYIGLEGLKTTSGFTFDQYYVVVTGVINKTGAMTYYVNSFPDFKVPGKYPIGKEVADLNAAKKHIAILLAHNDFAVTGDKLPLPVDDSRAKNSGITSLKGVEKVAVVDDELIVSLAPTVKTDTMVNKIVIEIMARLKSILNNRTSKNIFTYKVSTVKGKKTIKFILVPNTDRSTKDINLDRLHEVSDFMGLTPAQQKALKFALVHN